jgi:hypothetical protein
VRTRFGVIRFLSILAALAVLGCGGGNHPGPSGGSPDAAVPSASENVLPLVVDAGPTGAGYMNALFATATVCVPGTSHCQTFDHMLVDTGSVGVRLLGSALTIPLPAAQNPSGVAFAECNQFVLGFTWGPVRVADVVLGGERAGSIPLQVIEQATYPVPTSCTGVNQDTVETLGANGILGIGPFLQDCGTACEESLGPASANPGLYYGCASGAPGGCSETAVPANSQVSNPVAGFATDNNGTMIELPAISDAGVPSVSGSLVIGIGTRSNNALGATTILALDDNAGFVTRFPAGGTTYRSFVDSGSNGLYFLDSATTGIPPCPSPDTEYYCPSAPKALSAEHIGADGTAHRVNFTVANAETLIGNQAAFAYNDLAGPGGGSQPSSSGIGPMFDWGLPFFYGRSVYTAIERHATPVGIGPFVAY